MREGATTVKDKRSRSRAPNGDGAKIALADMQVRGTGAFGPGEGIAARYPYPRTFSAEMVV